MTDTETMADIGDRPATKRDLDQLRDEINIDFSGKLNQLREDLTEQMRDMQTEVLRAFYDWARPMEIKLKSIPAIEERLGLLEERVSRIERGDKPPMRA